MLILHILHVRIFPQNRAILKSGKITLHDIIIITDTLDITIERVHSFLSIFGAVLATSVVRNLPIKFIA